MFLCLPERGKTHIYGQLVCVRLTAPFPVTAVIGVGSSESPADDGCSDGGDDKLSRPVLCALG